MPKRQNTALTRVQRFYRRQPPDQPRWGPSYRPAIRATRSEAPRRSRSTIICRQNKLRRELHLLSLPERACCLLALYHPHVFDIHEQRILDPAPAPHPLHGHPSFGVGQQHDPLPGTWATAERLGYIAHHPTLSFIDDVGTKRRAPHPLMGDLLLFVRDDSDQPFCVNWNIKAHANGFLTRQNSYTSRNPQKAAEKQVARNAIEREFYADAGITTHEISADALPLALTSNLQAAFAAQTQPELPGNVERELLARLRDAIGSRLNPVDLLTHANLKFGVTQPQFRDLLFRAIWQRRLRIDLFRRILFDRPLRAEQTDVLSHFAAWFKGGDS